MKTKLDITLIRVAVGIFVYFAMLGLAAIATFALVVGPEQFGVTESWPLVFYFVVPYLATVVVGFGIVTVVRDGPGLMRRVL
jgi:hypothetical protein